MIALALALFQAAATPAITPPRLPPVELCRGDQEFERFRIELIEAVGSRSVAALRRLAADDIRSSFGGDGGWDEFASSWDLDSDPSASELWSELQGQLELGCAPTEAGGRVFPGMFHNSGEDSDPFELVVARPGAGLYSTPGDAHPVAKLDWHSARQSEQADGSEWVSVTLFDGRTGWLKAADAISPLGYRLVAERLGGRWQIAAFVAGD